MARHIALTAGLLLVCGCGQPVGEIVRVNQASPYRPGESYTLAYRTEFISGGVSSVSGTRVIDGQGESRLIDREETRSTSGEWGEMALLVEAKDSDTAGHVDLLMKFTRQAGGHWYRRDDGDSGEESFDTDTPPADRTKQREHEERLAAMDAVSFLATLDEGGRVAAFDASGMAFEGIKREIAEAGEAVSEDDKKMALAFHSLGVFSALDDALAYLPPSGDLATGQDWRVEREKVYPYHPYAFYMFTDGCALAAEESTCRVEAIERTGDGPIATISITGKRVPYGPEEGMPERVSRIDILGELHLNLDTYEVTGLRIKGTPHFISAEDRNGFSITFIDSVDVGLVEDGAATGESIDW